MKGFLFTFITFIIIIGLCVGGYFAFVSMTKPASYISTNDEVIGDMRSIVTDPDTGTSDEAAAAEMTSTAQIAPQSAAAAPLAPATPTATASAPASSASLTLSSQIAVMVSNNVSLKLGDKNANVGTVEQFMNLYFNKNSAIDNTFGSSLEADVTIFQKQNKISQTGTVATATLQMMQLWLKNNPQ